MAKAKTKNGSKKKHIKNKYNQPILWGALTISLLFIVLAFFSQWGLKNDVELYFAFFASLVFLFTFIKKENRSLLCEKVTPLSILLSAHTLLFLIGLFYASFPKFALQQFFLNVGGWFVFASAYITFLRDENRIRKFMAMMVVCIALVSIVSIELASSRLLIGLFNTIAGWIAGTVPSGYATFETNTRITSVMGNPNTYAPIAVIGMLMAVWLSGKAGSRKHQSALYMGIAVLSGSAFILSFSMGTLAMLAPALLGLLFFAQKEERKTLFLTIAFGLFISIIGAASAFTLMRKGILPSVVVLVVSAGAGYLFAFMKPIQITAIATNGIATHEKTRIVFYAIGGAVLCTVAVLALVFKGAYPLAPSEGFRRAVALDAGTYTLGTTFSGDPESAATVTISSMSLEQAALKEQATIAAATVKSGDQLVFTVPEGSKAVFFNLVANTNLTVTNALIRSEGYTRSISLKYSLIPEFIVNRMQALWINDNAIQRFVFFRDGLRVGMTSPIIGLGGGAYEGKIYNKSDYYYETVHTHNHYIQCFIDGGIIGFLLFAGTAVFAIFALLRAKKEKKNVEGFPFLAGSILLIFLHSLIEVDFSAPAFRVLVAVLLAWTASQYEFRIKAKNVSGAAANGIATTAVIVLTASSLLLSSGRLMAVDSLVTSPTLESLEKAVTLDPFNGDDYKISYLLSTMDNTENGVITSRSNTYLQSIERRTITPDSAVLLSQYNFFKAYPNVERGVELAEYYIREKRVHPKVWDEVLSTYFTRISSASEEDRDLIAASIGRLSEYLTELNSTLPKEIKPKLISSALNWAKLRAEDPDSTNTMDSRLFIDLNVDGVSDLVESQSEDQINWKFNLASTGTDIYILKVYMPEDGICGVLINGTELSREYDAADKCYTAVISGASSDIKVSAGPNPNEIYFTVAKID